MFDGDRLVCSTKHVTPLDNLESEQIRRVEGSPKAIPIGPDSLYSSPSSLRIADSTMGSRWSRACRCFMSKSRSLSAPG